MDKEETILSRYIKQGWKLTQLECPVCGSPLLKKDDKLFCAICNREVKIAESIEEYIKYLEDNVRQMVREKVIKSIQKIIEEIDIIDGESADLLEKYLKLLKLLRE